MTSEALANQSFSQAQAFISILNCDLSPLKSHIERLGRTDDLGALKKQCLRSISELCEEYIQQRDQALVSDDFGTVAMVLDRSSKLLNALHEYVIPRMKNELTVCAVRIVREHTKGNRDRALQLIDSHSFDDKLAALLESVKAASQNESMLHHVRLHLEREFQTGEEDYQVVTSRLNLCLITLANELNDKFTRDEAASTFEQEAMILDKIDIAEHLLKEHLTVQTKEARQTCRQTVAGFKERTFKQLQDAVKNSEWKAADMLFKCMTAASMGSAEEKKSVQSRLEGQT